MIRLKDIKKFKTFISTNIENIECEVSLGMNSQRISKEEFFLPIIGERFNAHKFIQDVINKGCHHFIFDRTRKENESFINPFQKNSNWIEVSSTLDFLHEFTRCISRYIKDNGGNVIAISGSNGKTTTREMLFCLLNAINENTISTQKNNNNHIGVPLTILQANKLTENIIVELGSNHPGEIQTLCEIAEPNIGITTNIGATHLEFFNSIDEVFEEEAYLGRWIDSYPKGNLFFQNIDDDFLKKIKSNKIKTYGKNASDFSFKIIKQGVSVEVEGESYEVINEYITGEHNFYNLGVAFIIAQTLYPNNKKEILQACRCFKPTSNRSEWINIRKTKVFLDAYNANPSSMLSSLSSFKNSSENKSSLVVLGDMNELGSFTEQYHKDVASRVKEMCFTQAVFIGKYQEYYKSGFGTDALFYNSWEEYKELFNESLDKYDFIFIKGSRSLQLERLIDIT